MTNIVDLERDHLIEALEQMDLPAMPTKVQALIDASPSYLVELLRALADDMEHPDKGALALAALPPEGMLCYTGLLQISKSGQRLRRHAQLLELENAKLQRKMLPDNHLH
jgi:hypothetical protein